MSVKDYQYHHEIIDKSSRLSAVCKDARESEDAYTIGEIRQLIEDCEDHLLEIASYLEDLE